MTKIRNRGFSLVELMITVAVAAVLTAIAYPSFRDFLHRNSVTAQANQVLASLQYARNEAVSRRYPTAVCGSTGAPATAPTCDGGDTLESGWLIWRDSTLTGLPSFSLSGTPPDELLRVVQVQPNITMRLFPANASNDLIAFDQRGRVIGAGGIASTVVICAKQKSDDPLGTSTDRVHGRRVIIDASGRITVQDLPSGGNCNAAS